MVRSFLFVTLFYIETALFLVLGSWLFFAPRSWAMAGLAAHGRTSVWLMRLVVGTRLEVRGKQNLPPGPVLVASKHQSAWDTFGLIPLMHDPAMVMKKELQWIPFYGWFSHKFRMIFVARERGPSALKKMIRDVRDRGAAGREIVVFPEGTRRLPGAPPDYKTGIIPLYEALDVACVPVALNSGLFWPRRSWRRYPGTLVVEFLEPIPPGLGRKEFLARLQSAIEAASWRLVEEVAQSNSAPPTASEALERRKAAG